MLACGGIEHTDGVARAQLAEDEFALGGTAHVGGQNSAANAHRGVWRGDFETFAVLLHHLAGDHPGQAPAHAQGEAGLGRSAEAEISDIDHAVRCHGHRGVVGKKQLQLAGGVGADLIFFIQRIFQFEGRARISALHKGPRRHGDDPRGFGGPG